MINQRRTTLIATLGGQPQIVTLALDTLLERQVPIQQVIVVHLELAISERYQHAMAKLRDAFCQRRYQQRGITLTPFPLRQKGVTLSDVRDESDANGVWEVVNRLIIELKEAQHTLHVCVSGGRRMLGLMTMSAAMLHFGHQDMLWHMYTPDDWLKKVREGAMMHLPADSGFSLIQVPMMPWGSYFPALRTLTKPVTQGDVLAAPKGLLEYGEETRRTAVLRQLTRRQTEVLQAFASGKDREGVAAALHISVKTVDSHKTVILDECRNAWDLPGEMHLGYRFIAEKFGGMPD